MAVLLMVVVDTIALVWVGGAVLSFTARIYRVRRDGTFTSRALPEIAAESLSWPVRAMRRARRRFARHRR